MITSVIAGNHNFGWISQGDTAVVISFLLNTDREQTFGIGVLPFVHLIIQRAHGRILKINKIVFVDVSHGKFPPESLVSVIGGLGAPVVVAYVDRLLLVLLQVRFLVGEDHRQGLVLAPSRQRRNAAALASDAQHANLDAG